MIPILEKNSVLNAHYSDLLREYIDLGHVALVTMELSVA